MNAFLTYELKVALLLIATYSAYSLLLRRDTWFRLRRLVLLASVVLSFVLPFCVIEIHRIEVVNLGMGSTASMAAEEGTTSGNGISGWMPYVGQGIVALMVVGMALMALRMSIELLRIHRFIRRTEIHKEENGMNVGLSDELVQPFSYMKYVVMSKSDYQLRRQAIMAHEQAHIAHHHTLDLYLVNLALVVQWFNPAIWAISKEMVRVHEYEADDDVVNSGISTETYFKLLMDKATSKVGLRFTNSLGEKGMLRDRIEMLASRRSSVRSRLKALYLIPIVAISLAVSAKSVTDYKIMENPRPESKATVDAGAKGKEYKEQDAGIDAEDTVLYYANIDEIAPDDLENIDPSSIEEVNIVKAHDKKESVGADGKHPKTVYVDLSDTIIKKGDDGTYEMYSYDFSLTEEQEKQMEKEMADFQNQKSEIEEQAREAVEDAQKRRAEALEQARKVRSEADKRRAETLEQARKSRAEALEQARKSRTEALEQARKARTEALEQARKAKVDAEKQKAEAMKQREEALKQAEKALKDSEKALKESERVLKEQKRYFEQNALKESRKALKESERVLKEQKKYFNRKKKEYAIVADTLKQVVENNTSDSSNIRLYVSSDGSISNINAYKIDTITGNNFLVIRMNDGNKQIVSLYRNLKSKV